MCEDVQFCNILSLQKKRSLAELQATNTIRVNAGNQYTLNYSMNELLWPVGISWLWRLSLHVSLCTQVTVCAQDFFKTQQHARTCKILGIPAIAESPSYLVQFLHNVWKLAFLAIIPYLSCVSFTVLARTSTWVLRTEIKQLQFLTVL